MHVFLIALFTVSNFPAIFFQKKIAENDFFTYWTKSFANKNNESLNVNDLLSHDIELQISYKFLSLNVNGPLNLPLKQI